MIIKTKKKKEKKNKIQNRLKLLPHIKPEHNFHIECMRDRDRERKLNTFVKFLYGNKLVSKQVDIIIETHSHNSYYHK